MDRKLRDKVVMEVFQDLQVKAKEFEPDLFEKLLELLVSGDEAAIEDL